MATAPFDALLDRYQSGEATADELGELDRQLRADAGKRRVLVERTLLEVQLRKFFRGLAPAAPPRRLPHARRWPIVVVIVIALALGLGLFALLRRGGGSAGPAATVESGVVRVKEEATAIVPAETPFVVGGQIPAVLRLPDGAHAELDIGTRAALFDAAGNQPRRIDVMHGGGKFAVAAGQAPLRIETPIGNVLADAARFSVRLGKAAGGAGVLTVAVDAGTVAVETGGQQQTLAAGQQRVFAAPAGR